MTATRLAAVAALILAALPTSPACTFCDGTFRAKQTLRMHFARAKVVLHGQLKNARFDPKTDEGTTDLHVSAVLKDDPARGNKAVLTLAKYYPVVGDTPPDYLIFCDVVNGRLDPSYGIAAPAAVVDYLKAATALDDADPVKKLSFFFKHLDSKHEPLATDAFFEFARASDTEIVKAAGQFDAAKLRTLLADPNQPVERLGVFAFLLGNCGTPDDAVFLGKMLKQTPVPERVSAAFGGLLAGYVLLDPKGGWAFAAAVLAEPEGDYARKLATLGTVRFFQATRPAQCKAEVLKCCAALLPQGDLADQAFEDLRRWGYWELTADVLAQYGKPSHAVPVIKRGIIRYAITCPKDEARAFLDATRKADPKLVKDVEDALKLYEPAKPSKP